MLRNNFRMKLHTNRLPHLLIILLVTILPRQSVAAQTSFSKEDFSRWLDDAYIAQATYESDDGLAELLSKRGYTLTKSKEIPGFEVSYLLATNDVTRHHLIAVRGTANIKNVIVDSAFVLLADKITGIDIHQGFLLSSSGIYQQLLPDIKPGYKIKTIGHSLGGATALILAMMFDAQGYPVDEVVTFGQPKVTNISGNKKFAHLNVKRLVTDKDIVPLVPPADILELSNISIFWHQGTEIILYQDNRYSVLSGMDSMRRTVDFLNETPGEHNLNGHFMATYIKYIKAKLENQKEIDYKFDFSFSDWFGSSSETKK